MLFHSNSNSTDVYAQGTDYCLLLGKRSCFLLHLAGASPVLADFTELPWLLDASGWFKGCKLIEGPVIEEAAIWPMAD